MLKNHSSNYSVDIKSDYASYGYRNSEIINNKTIPTIDTSNLIAGTTKNGCLIPNYKYFISNPTIGENINGEVYGNGNSGTCGPVAAQLLLGYNNYYNDRRIIENRFLNGYDDASQTIVNPEFNPNFCSDPMNMTSDVIGTRSEGVGENSFYSEIITRIMEPNTIGSSNVEVKNGIESYLAERLLTSDFVIDYDEEEWNFGYSPVKSSIIKSEIDKGRPIIISMDSNLGGINHFVVGYGYQNYTYPDGNGTYDGYVVHFGWHGSGSSCVWINSSWCDGYVSLRFKHEHNYHKEGRILGTDRMEYKCNICGHRTDSVIHMSSSERYVEKKVSLSMGEHKDYFLKFETEGNKLIQTFGLKDTVISLYDADNNLLAKNDDDGISSNAFLNYSVIANKMYILRVKFYNNSESGDFNLGITPSSKVYSSFINVWNYTGTYAIFNFTSSLYRTTIMTFTASQSGTYTLQTNYYGNDVIDTYLYFIDPFDIGECLYNDDGAGNLQAKLTIDFEKNHTYFFIVSTYDISSTYGQLSLSVKKNA